MEVAQGQNKMTAALPNLQPCSTYCIRLVAVRPDGVESDPGPEIVIDTQGKVKFAGDGRAWHACVPFMFLHSVTYTTATNCTPKPKSCCVC